MTDRRIRYSEIKSWQQCRRQWRWGYQMGLDRVSEAPDTSDVGSLCHEALESYYLGSTDPGALIRARRSERTEQGGGALDKKWSDTFTLAEIMVDGYVEWVESEGIDADYRVLAAEQRIEVPFGTVRGDHVVLTGQLDLQVEHTPSGLRYLRDFKSVQSLDQAGRQLQMDSQLLTYAVMLRMQDIRIAGAEHMMLRRVKRSATATPPFYGVAQVAFSETQLRNHWTHLNALLHDIVGAYQSLEASADPHAVCPPNPGRDCTWRCSAPGIDGCLMEDDGANVSGFVQAMFITRKKV